MKYTVLFLMFMLLIPSLVRGQDWVVPEERRGRLSTFPFTDETRKDGERLYNINCLSCHGTPGKNNYIALVPSPGDPATEKIQRNSDGEIFHKVSVGRGPMPSFRSVLTTDEIWKVVSYLRSFNRSYIQKVMPVITSTAYPGAVINLTLTYSEATRLLTVRAMATDEVKSVPVTGAGVRLFATRYFGMLAIDEEKQTGNDGSASFTIPEGLPGDTAGNISFSAKFTDEDLFGAVSKDTIIRAGTETRVASLVAQKAMWNNVRKAPVWVILSYGLGVIAVWGFIFLVMMKLRDIYTVGSALQGKLRTFPEQETTTKQEEI
ncbi:cytochrome c [bacterium]|jgi:mono/diheme cytochrome c family protein|nr:cytochrome c [bacterium]